MDQSCDVSSMQPPCCDQKAAGEDCSFPCKRPIPEQDVPAMDLANPLPKVVNTTQHEYKYTGEALRAVELPLGPIGGGCISIAGDGGLRQWQINNKVNHDAHVPDSFFAIRVDSVDGTKSAVLQSNALYDNSGFTPAPLITDATVPPASKVLLHQLPGVKTLEVTAKFPVVEAEKKLPGNGTNFLVSCIHSELEIPVSIDYMGNEVPVKVHMEAYNPKIPLSSMDSGIPVVVFNFTVTNSTSQAVKVSMLGSQQNMAGWNCYDVITNEVNANGYGGNLNALYTTSSFYGIDMSNSSLRSDDAFNGHVAVGFMKQPGDQFSTMLQYSSAAHMWSHFVGSGFPGQGSVGPSPTGQTWNGAVACTRSIQPGKSTVFTYMLGWHFPNRYRDWKLYVSIPKTNPYIGNQYNKLWKSVTDVLDYVAFNYERLNSTTYKFRDSMFNSTLPWQLVDSAANRACVTNSPSCMWAEDGFFYAFEGCCNKVGCCPLNCTHVWNYEMCLAKLYPDLERIMREIDLLHQINPHGVIPSRTVAPMQMERVWNLWGNYSTYPSSTNICVDGEIGTVLKTYREIKHGASSAWAAQMWGPVKKIMTRWLDELDDGNGLIKGAQPNTYDTSIYGVNSFMGSYYLCALRAAEEMAQMQGDSDFANKCRGRFELGSVNLDRACFPNGKWYTQLVDPNHEVELLTDSSFMDALVGQWWAHALGLGYLLPKDHITSNLTHCEKRNYVKKFNPANQYPRKFCDERDSGYYLGKWDEGPPKNQLLYTNEACWSGVAHAFVGLCLYEGLTDTALKVVSTIRSQYDGTRRSPWNEIECGDYYTRAMSAFLYFEISSGQTWNYVTDTAISLGFAPRLNAHDFRGFFILGSCWGQYVQNVDEQKKNGSAKIDVAYGTLTLAELRLNVTCKAAVATVNDEVIPQVQTYLKISPRTMLTLPSCEMALAEIEENGQVSLKFSKLLTVSEGQTLAINLFG